MPDISAVAVKTLREKTGVPMMDCKEALVAANGDMEGAERILREKNKKVQETRLGRDTSEGRIGVYVDLGQGDHGIIVPMSIGIVKNFHRPLTG